MRTFAQKQKQPQKPVSSSPARSHMATLGPAHREHPILHLQHAIGNQAVQRMLQANTEELEAGLIGMALPRFEHDFSRIPIHPPVVGAIQTKLGINKPGNEYEQEADHVSDQVMRMPDPRPQGTCACGGGCPKCQTEQPGQEHERLQAKRVGSSDLEQTPVPPIVHEVLRSPGQSLDRATRSFMEPRFGRDFSRVRVHADVAAERSAQDLNARAYTAGHNIVFGAGEFTPSMQEGRRLIAHELTHVLQQSDGERVIHRQPIEGNESVGAKSRGASHPAKQLPSVQKLPEANIVFLDHSNRWLITIGGIAVAEIAVKSKVTPLEIQIDITPQAAVVTIRHHGDASLARSTNPLGTLAMPVSLREIDLREDARDYAGPRAPTTLEERTATGEVQVTIAPPSALHWPDEAVGELNIKQPLAPGSLSEFEHQLRQDRSLINGLILDPKTSEVIGYKRGGSGLTQFLDREGNVLSQDEAGLETPLIDPLDFIPTPGTVGKVGAGIIGRVGVKALGKKAAVKGTKLSLGVVARMRGVSKALFARALRKGAEEAPGFVRKITKAGLDHSFDRHAAQWFGRVVARDTHLKLWRELIERVAASSRTFPWSVGSAKTIGHLGRVEGKYFVVQFFEETGELATAFVPNSSQLSEMLRLLKGAL